MLIDRKTPGVAELLAKWNTLQPMEKYDRRERFKQRLAKSVIEPALRQFAGQLIIFYYEFLTKVPSGAHSFAYGTEMMSKTIYWVTTGRIRNDRALSLIATPAQKLMLSSPKKGAVPKIRTVTSGKDRSIPIQWSEHLETHYHSGSNHPYFIRKNPAAKHTPAQGDSRKVLSIDISDFEHSLFRLVPGQFDWAINTALIIGTTEVRNWLAKHGSADTFPELAKRRP